MKEEISAGGVVIFGNALLLLKKYNGDWVLPKGKVEKDEEIINTAIREVYEEGGVKAKAIEYIGKINYSFKTSWRNNEVINKTVHWYLMKARNMECSPQKKEGFIEAKFIYISRAIEIARYDDEREIIIKAKNDFIKKTLHEL